MNLSMRNPSVGYSPQMGFKWKYTQSSQSANFLLEAKSLDYIVQKHRNSIIDICGYIILSDHYRRIARLYERLEDFSSVKRFYYKAFLTAPLWWKNILYIIFFSFSLKIGLYLAYLGREYKNKQNV